MIQTSCEKFGDIKNQTEGGRNVKSLVVGVVVVLILLAVIPVSAQKIGPEAPILGKGVLGLNGLAVLEVALPTEYSYNPAAVPVALQMFNEKQYAEADYGIINFSNGPEVTNTWQLYAFQLKDGSALRLARFSIASDKRSIAFLGPQGPQVEFKGESYEVSYGRFLNSKTTVGIAIVPYENIRTILSADILTLGQAEAKSDFHVRVGGLYFFSPELSIGAVYTYDSIDAITRLFPTLTELPEVLTLHGKYRERLLTGGLGYQPREGTILFFSWQKGKIVGPNLHEGIDLKAYGFQQYLNPRLAVRIGIYDRIPGYEVTYTSHDWTLGASIAKDTYRRTEEFIGLADTMYFWIGKSW